MATFVDDRADLLKRKRRVAIWLGAASALFAVFAFFTVHWLLAQEPQGVPASSIHMTGGVTTEGVNFDVNVEGEGDSFLQLAKLAVFTFAGVVVICFAMVCWLTIRLRSIGASH